MIWNALQFHGRNGLLSATLKADMGPQIFSKSSRSTRGIKVSRFTKVPDLLGALKFPDLQMFQIY